MIAFVSHKSKQSSEIGFVFCITYQYPNPNPNPNSNPKRSFLSIKFFYIEWRSYKNYSPGQIFVNFMDPFTDKLNTLSLSSFGDITITNSFSKLRPIM